MKITYKLLIIFIISISFIIYMPQTSSATKVSTIVGSVFPPKEQEGDYTEIQEIIGKVLGFLQIASGLASVLVIGFTGFNYIIATPDVKKELKDKMLPMVIGLVLIFGAVSITKFLLGAVQGSYSITNPYG